jgi:hypothetical protein
MIGYILHNEDCTDFPQFVETSAGGPPLHDIPEGYLWTESPCPSREYRVTKDSQGDYAVIPYVMEPADLLALVQSTRWTDAKTYRDMRMASICETPVGVVQIDDQSKVKISGLVQMATLSKITGSAFSATFTLFNNNTVNLDADQMISLGVAVGEFVQACQDAGTNIRNQIDQATTPEAVAAIDITAGYP